MMHHVFGPHFLGAPLFPGVPNLVLFILLGLGVWYFLKRDKQTESQAPHSKDSSISETQDLRDEINQLKKKNDLLRELLKRDLEKK